MAVKRIQVLKKSTALLLVTLSLLLPGSHAFAANATGQQKPNITFILVDDTGWGDLSCMGHPMP